MFLRKKGYPQEGETVLCTITKIHFHSVFANLDEYDKSGMIHISEVSPGRIRNLSDFVAEGKVVVCKILRVNLEKGHIDLSLRRVNKAQKINKINEIKQEQLAERIIEFGAKELKIPAKKLYTDVFSKVSEKYELLYPCFLNIVINGGGLEDLGVEPAVAVKLNELIRLRIKPPEVSIKGDLMLKSYDPCGVVIVRDILKHIKSDNIDLKYISGGKYRVSVVAREYKVAEKMLEDSLQYAQKHIADGEYDFKREK